MDCANEEGYTQAINWRPQSMFSSIWSNPFSLFDDFFNRPSLLPSFGFGSRLFGPRFMLPVMTWPNIEITLGETEDEDTGADENHASSIPDDAGEEIKKKREIAALKHQLKATVKAENYEEAIILRDKIKELEKK
ncbi:MAG: UvrB/UvrC motif-containing protein [Oscillospiraceae bacterium]